jgi:hypothetical protein
VVGGGGQQPGSADGNAGKGNGTMRIRLPAGKAG